MSKREPQNMDVQAKRELLTRLLRQQAKASEIPDYFPMSFAQRRLWFLHQWQTGAHYHMPVFLRISGPLRPDLLEKAFQALIERHESLRTTFILKDEMPTQVIARELPFTLSILDLQKASEEEVAQELQHLTELLVQQPFDLSKGPLLRTILLRKAPEEYMWLICLHHIIADAWSIDILMHELSSHYNGLITNQVVSLPPLALHYADFAVWQMKHLENEQSQQHLAYWRQQLAGVPEKLDLPGELSSLGDELPSSAYWHFSLSPAQVQQVRVLSAQQGTTPFMTFLALFQVLLAHYSNQRDICIGTPVANRTRQETEALIGFFVNMLALRVDLSGNPGFEEVLQRVKRVTLEAYSHQDIPFEQVVEEMHLQRDANRTPVFQVVFSFQKAPQEGFQLADLQIEFQEIETGAPKFDLSLTLEERGNGSIHAKCEYDTKRFEESLIQGLAQHYLVLLDQVLADPQKPVFGLSLLTSQEQEQIVEMWNATERLYPFERLFPDLFAAQVQRTPHAQALVYRGTILTYQELFERVDRFSHYLQTLGVSPDVLVAVLMERTPEMLIALLAILQAGGAYLPLDPAYPRERLAYMLQDSHARVLVSQQSLFAQLPSFDGWQIDFHPGWQSPVSCKAGTEAKMLTEQSLAYMIYTSGSTGYPKGVALTHRNLVNFLQWSLERYTPAELSRVLAHASICFDISLIELFTPLCCGGTVILLDTLLHVSEVMSANATFLWSVPSLLKEFLNQSSLPASLRALLLGGEALPLSLVHQLERYPWLERIDNLYGPTEGTVVCTASPITVHDSFVSIGSPIANTETYVLSQHLQPVPVGVVGELYIGGQGLARGYHNRPELTADRFLPHPFSHKPGQRLYRTGDMVCYLPDGRIRFLGRADDQVKIRGLRIELGEIEALLEHHPRVRSAVVVKGRHPAQYECLIAYVVGEQLEDQELRAYLSLTLADFMLPAIFVFLPALPSLANGKIDRKKLPQPDWTQMRRATSERVAPRTATEATLMTIWQQLLGREEFGIEDNFFDIGGHSLLVIQLQNRIRTQFAQEITLRTLFKAATIASQGELIDANLGWRAEQSPLQRYPRNEALPLSFSQQRLWFLEQLQAQQSLYILPAALRLSGPLQMQCLEKSFQILIDRHEVFRTTFATESGRPVQRIAAHCAFAFQRVDLQAVSPEQQASEIQHLVQDELLQPFDMAQAPFLRAIVAQIGPESSLLLVGVHHSIFDGWSLNIFIRELSTCYAQLTEKDSVVRLPELPLQYADFARWQRERFQRGEFEEQIRYWRKQLSGAPELLDLPTDRPRPLLPTTGGATHRFSLSAELVTEARRLCQQQRVTPFTWFCSVFFLLLTRYSNQEDISIGTPFAARERRELEDLIGCFVNTLVLRVDLSGNPGFAQLLQRVSEAVLDASVHQDVPFEYLVEVLQPKRNLTVSPLFQVLFALQSAPQEQVHLPQIVCEWQPLETGRARFDLAMTLEEQPTGEMVVQIEFSTALFEQATIQRFAQHYQILCENCLRSLERPIADIAHMSEQERVWLLSTLSHSQSFPLPVHCLHTLFERQVAATPKAPALTWCGEQQTYAELNQRANQVAHWLRTQQVGPGTPVGLYLEPSFALIIGILGILKAGGAYVPLDARTPLDRIDFIVEDTHAELVLTQKSLQDRIAERIASIKVACLDDEEVWLDESDEKLNVPATLDQVAYIIYTSGSTGTPKGVMVTHRNVVNLVAGSACWLDLSLCNTWALFHSPAFDMSVWEIWGALLCGGRLVIVPYEITRSPLDFYRFLAQEQVNLLNQTPSAFLQLADVEDEIDQPLPLALRYVTFGGEALDFQKLLPWLKRHGEATPRLINLYGITETTVHSTHRLVTLEDAEGARSKMIGKPLPNVRLYLLDRYRQPVSVGVIGEIFVGGEGVAQGYLNRPEQNAERFLLHTFPGEQEQRLYRSGDLARYHANGDIEYLGRNDTQVKIRGFRIEPAEIETRLLVHPSIKQSAVIARQTKNGDTGLIAFLVKKEESPAPSKEELKVFLDEALPAYMLPAAFVFLEALPLTRNGKLDRRLLLSGVWEEAQTREYVAPRSPVEKQLQQIWSEVLGVESISVDDNFFAIGGHSLLMTQIAFRIRRTYQIDAPLTVLFTHTTIAEQTRWLEKVQANGEQRTQPFSLLTSRVHPEELPLSSSQQRLWVLEQLSGGSTFYTIPIAVRIRGPVNFAWLKRSMQAVVERHEALRSSFVFHKGRVTLHIQPEVSLPIKSFDISSLPETEREARIRELLSTEGASSFDLEKGPFLRAVFVSVSPEQAVLGLFVHHIVCDGWSCQILVREIAAFYEAYSQQKEPLLPVLPIQYADFALWEQDWLKSPALEKQLSYWKEQLRSLPEPLQFPTDHPRPAVQSFEGKTSLFEFEPSLWESIQGYSRQEGCTTFMLLLTALQLLLSRYTGQQHISVGTPIANRRHLETEPLIGMFVNILVIDTDLSANPTFAEALRQVKRLTLNAYENQDVPFEKLIEELHLPYNTSTPPLFQVFFAMQNMPEASLTLHDITLEEMSISTDTAKYEISFYLREQGGKLQCMVEYNRSIFEPDTIERFMRNYQVLLKAALASPTVPVATLPLISADELAQLQHFSLPTSEAYREDICLQQLFEEQVQRSPEAIAARFQGVTMTYQQLNQQANQLAHFLRKKGIGADCCVGLCIERSLALIVSFLGILKAGGAYLPLDPAYPKSRRDFMLTHARAAVILTQQSLLPSFDEREHQIICFDSDQAAIAKEADGNPESITASENLAYVIYTSGSTGIPKGIAMPHGPLVNLIEWQCKQSRVGAGNCTVQFTSISFDVALQEIFATWATGGVLEIISEEQRRDSKALVQVLQDSQAERIFLPFVALQQLAEAFSGQIAPSCRLREVITAGEQLQITPTLSRLFAEVQGAGLYNQYGPSETHIVTEYRMESRIDAWPALPPIGQPLQNITGYVLDEHLQRVPIGVIGELYLGGVGLARGYLHRPDVTAERFLCDPFSSIPGRRMYKTGDVARYLPDGNIEFLGRRDNQVKIRGFRVELGEIETLLNEHTQVQQAVVVAQTQEHQKQLVAYIVPSQTEGITREELREYLFQKLPEYMVPTLFVFLMTFPLTPSGKVDRRALPVPDRSRPQLTTVYTAPATLQEKALVKIWQEVLQVEQVGIHDNFFDLGGHSLLMVQLYEKVAQVWQQEITLLDLFHYPTIHILAQHIRGQQRTQQDVLVADSRALQRQSGKARLKQQQERRNSQR